MPKKNNTSKDGWNTSRKSWTRSKRARRDLLDYGYLVSPGMWDVPPELVTAWDEAREELLAEERGEITVPEPPGEERIWDPSDECWVDVIVFDDDGMDELQAAK